MTEIPKSNVSPNLRKYRNRWKLPQWQNPLLSLKTHPLSLQQVGFNLGTDVESIKEQVDNYLDSALCVHLR